MKLLIAEFSPASCYFPSGPCILFSSLFSYSVKLCSYIWVKDCLVPIQNNAVHKIIFLYILLLMFLDRKWEGKRF